MSLQHPILRRSLAGILLVLFALSIMPKKVLHDLIVSHKDGVNTTKSVTPQVGKAGFNCDCQNLVTESPFIADGQQIDLSFHPDYSIEPCTFSSQVYTTALLFYSLRGPPAIS